MKFRLRTPSPFELPLAVRGHGWYGLLPHRWDEDNKRFTTVIDLGTTIVEVSVTQAGNSLRVSMRSRRELNSEQLTIARSRIRTILRLDEDLTDFWKRCRREPRLRWVARRGAGRLLRSASLFEDLVKLLFTTNCSWAATRNMNERLVSALGRKGPSGDRAFPSAKACAAKDESFFRDVVRAGYRAPHCAALASGFASDRIRDEDFTDPQLPTEEVRGRLLSLSGFGPYAAGQAMRLLGRYDDLALDSWCRAKLARMQRRKRPPSDRAIARQYAPFGGYQGLVLWMDLTADWHRGESALG